MADLPPLPSFRPISCLRDKWDLLSPDSKKRESDVVATKIQKVWKGHQTRKEYKWIIDKVKAKATHKAAKEHVAAAEKIKSGIKTVSAQRGSTKAQLAEATPSKKAESQKFKRSFAKVKPKTEKVEKSTDHVTSGWEIAKADKIRFVQRVVLQDIIDKAFLYGESLLLSRQIQCNFEQRPVFKDIFTLSHEFQYAVTDPLPHTLHSISSLGRVLYLESMGNLQQIDVTSEKHLSPYFLGVRMPLKYTPLLDMVCDVKSCRIYTLNTLWKLEVWSLEQTSPLPLKRVPMVNCEVSRDYTRCYKSRHLFSKPSFLSMANSANQILLVNTTCVDGNIVFVDPVSLSILRKLHFVFREYEVPMHIKEAIDKLKVVMHSVKGSILEVLKKIGKGKEDVEMRYEDFVNSLKDLCKDIDSSLLYDICRQIDINNNGFISLEELTPYIEEEQGQAKIETKRFMSGVWPEWLVSENKIYLAKQILGKIIDSISHYGVPPEKAFRVFDPEDSGIVNDTDFAKVLSKLCPEIAADEVALIVKLADGFQDKKIRYKEFERFLDKKVLQTDVDIEEIERTLREPLVHKNDLPTLIRKAFENSIGLREIFKKEDQFQQGLIEKNRFYHILESLPLGYGPEDIYEIFNNTAIFDAHGNADYTVILQHDAYAILENSYLQKKKSALGQNESTRTEGMADSRKVVVEDLVYLDDFDIILYTTVFPKSSNIYVSHTVPMKPAEEVQKDDEAVEKSEPMLTYKLLATLKGHSNTSPPTIHYVDETCCLISGEKDEEPQVLEEDVKNNYVSDKRQTPEQKELKLRIAGRAHKKVYEILIWNLQKDLVHIMQANPPWILRPTRRIDAHAGSILDITYLPSAQLIVTTSLDQTIKFFDPVAFPYPLSEPYQFPVGSHSIEYTTTNLPFMEVKRVYTSPSTCYQLRNLCLGSNKPLTGIEWLVALKLSPVDSFGSRKQLQGVISGYGTERVRLTVPAIRHDDPVPSAVYQECESSVMERRKKAVVAFQSVLPHNLEYLMANVALRNSLMNKLVELFKEATLNRANGRVICVKPIKEAFKVLLEIPERKNLIKEKGRSTALTVSEVYYYLKKYSQIHPTNLSQVMFARIVGALKESKEKTNFRKWHSDALNVFAMHIRKNGLPKSPQQYTLAEFIKYLTTLNLLLEDSQLENIAYEIDTLKSGYITLPQLEKMFADELKHYNITIFKRPSPIIDEIRAKVLPSKKLSLQEALGTVDKHGDGYITKKQFLEAFERAKVDMDKETLGYLFDLLGEKYVPKENEKILSVAHFLKKLLTEAESKEVMEITIILRKIAASLNYRGIEPEILFSDTPLEKLNITILPSKIKDVLEKTEFEKRVQSLNITNLSNVEIAKISNYLAVNDKSERIQIVYLRNYLHHLKNVSTSLPPASKKMLLAVMCTKLLVSETRFKRQCYELADIIEGCIEPAGIRAVLTANGIISKHADLFVEILMGAAKNNLEELIAKMRAEAALYYKDKYRQKTASSQVNYHEYLKKVFAESIKEEGPKPEHLAEVCKTFDKRNNGKIKVFHLLNILKYNLDKLDEMSIAGLQYELTLLHPSEFVDYNAFFQSFSDALSDSSVSTSELKQKELREELDATLKKIEAYLRKNRIDIKKAFEMFDIDQDELVTKEEFVNALYWVDLSLAPKEIDNIFTFNSKDVDYIKYKDFIELILHSTSVVTTFNKQQWASAAKGISLEDQCRVILDNLSQLTFLMQKEYPHQLVPGEVFMNCLRDASLGLSEEEIEMVTKYAIRGSKRLTKEQQANILSGVALDLNKDLINYPFFVQSIQMAFEGRVELKEESERPRIAYNPETAKKITKKKEADLINRVKAYFTKTGLSFYDYFFSEETGFLQTQLQRITRKQVLESVRVLKIPLSLQEQRLLVQMEDPFNANNIPVRSFCDKFETTNSLENRMKIALEKLTAAILLKDIQWDLAFDLFDKESKGYITRQDFIDLINYWKLGLTGFEIETMLQLIGEKRGNIVIITRDMFKEKIINNLQGLKDVVVQKLKQSLLIEINDKLSGKSFERWFEEADEEGSGMATAKMLVVVLDSLGIKGVTKKELQILLEIGNVQQVAHFPYTPFCKAVSSAMDGEIRRRNDSSTRIVENLFIVIRARKLSVFDAYCQFDVFLRGGISKLEFVSGLQSMGIESSQENINILWIATMSEFGGNAEKLSYHAFLSMFVKRGLLKVMEPESTASIIAAEFTKQLRISGSNLDTLYSSMDARRTGKVIRQDFVNSCRKFGINMTNEELYIIYGNIEDRELNGVTYKGLADFVQEGSKDEDKVTKIYTKIYRAWQRRKIDWEQAFAQEMKAKKEKAAPKQKVPESGLNSKSLSDVLRKQRIGLKADEIELAVNHLIYNPNGLITPRDFSEQLKEWVNKYLKKREEKIDLLKLFVHKVKNSLKKPDAKIEIVFSEVDKDDDGAIFFNEFLALLAKLGIDLSQKDAASIFSILAESINEKLRIEVLKRYMTSMEFIDQMEFTEEMQENEGNEEEADFKESVFQKIRTRLEEKERTLQQIFSKLKIDPITHVTAKGMKKVFENVDLAMSDKEIALIDAEIKKMYGQDQYSYQIFLDFMVRRRIDSSEIYSGLSDPGVVICLQALARALKKNSMTPLKAFETLSRHKGAFIAKMDFIQSLEGMQLGLSRDDITALFTSLDKRRSNTISKQEFLQGLAYATQTGTEQVQNGTIQNIQSIRANRVLKQVGDILEKGGYSLRQIAALFDVHGTGILSKAELTALLRERDFSIGLNDVRTLTNYLSSLGDGQIYTGDIVSRLEEIMNQDTEGLYSIKQSKPIIKKIQREVEGEISAFSDEILKYDKLLDEFTGKSGIDKKYFYKILNAFKAYLSEEEKAILNTAFEIKDHPSLLDTHKLMSMLETVTEEDAEVKKTKYTLDWERRIYRKIGNYLRRKGQTLADSFYDLSENGYVSQEDLAAHLKGFQVNLSEDEISALLALVAIGTDGKVKLKDFTKKFYEAYLLDADTTDIKLSKADEVSLILKVIKKMKEKHSCEKAFAILDQTKVGYLTVAGLQSGLPKFFDIHLTREQFLVLLNHMDSNNDGVISLKKFHKFYHELESDLKKQSVNTLTLEEIFHSVLDVMRERNLNLLDIFSQIDVNQNGYISTDEFVGLLRTIGYIISEEKAADLFKKADSGFDGKISYKTLHRGVKAVAVKYGISQFEDLGKDKIFSWRDKGVEAVLKMLNLCNKKHDSYFAQFDSNSDGVLTPREFREALKSLKSVTPSQVERLLVVLSTDKDHQPAVSISKLVDFLAQYDPVYAAQAGLPEELLVDEDLFVKIVQHFDGFTVLNDKTYSLYETTTYLSKHPTELKARGCQILSNSSMLSRLLNNTKKLALDLRDTLVSVSNTALNLIKAEAKKALLSKPSDTTPPQSNLLLASNVVEDYKVPDIDPRQIHVEKESKWTLPSGCTCYKGSYGAEKTRIRIQVYSTQVLSKVSSDRKVYRKHLELELAAQMLLHAKDPKSTFRILGKYEKKTGIGEHSVELYVVFEDFLLDEYISLEDFLNNNGGLLEMPLLKNTEAALYIAKLWTADILKGLSVLHDFGLVMRTLNASHLYLHKASSTVKFGHFRGIGKVDANGNTAVYPDIAIHSVRTAQEIYSDAHLSPEHVLLFPSEHTAMVDTWSVGSILYTILTGAPPESYFEEYKKWANSHNSIKLEVPVATPGEGTFIYAPVSYNRKIAEKWGMKNYLEDTRKTCNNTVAAVVLQSYSAITKGHSWMNPFKENKGKTVLGMVFDLIACCLDTDPTKRPSLKELIESKVLKIDSYERSSAAKFAKSVFLYKSPLLCITVQNRVPLRDLCLTALKTPERLLTHLESPILSIIDRVLNHIHTITTPHTESIKRVLIDLNQGASPHIPLAKQIVTDKIVDMLIFLCHRYTRLWLVQNRTEIKTIMNEAEEFARKSTGFEGTLENKKKPKAATSSTVSIKKGKYLDYNDIKKEKARKEAEEKEKALQEKRAKEALEARRKFEESIARSKKAHALKLKGENRVLSAVCNLVHKLVVEMQFKDSVMAPYVGKVLEYIIKLMIGEDYVLPSDFLSFNKDNLYGFHQIDSSDTLDKEWNKTHKGKPIVMHETFWDFTTYASVLSIYQDSIGIGGLGGGQYPVIHEFIQQCNSELDLTSSFGKHGNTQKRTSEYYSELGRLCESITVLTEESYGPEKKRQELARICSIFYGGNVERAKAALDLKITRYLHSLLQDTDEELRKYSLLILLQLSKALAVDSGLELPVPESLQTIKKDNNATTGTKIAQDVAKDKSLVNYIYGKTMANNSADIKRYITFAKELPTVHFEQNRELFKALGMPLQSPVFSATLARLLKDPHESTENKILVIRILLNLFTAGPSFIRSLTSAITDAYLTLATLLKSESKKPEKVLAKEIRQLFTKLFELRDPSINQFLLSNPVARDLLKESGLKIPTLKSLYELIETAEALWVAFTPDETGLIKDYKIPEYCKDMKSLLIHQKELRNSPEGQKLVRLSMEVLCKAAEAAWDLFETSRFKGELAGILKVITCTWEWLVAEGMCYAILEAKQGALLDWILIKVTQTLTTGSTEEDIVIVGVVLQKILAGLLKANQEQINETFEALSFGQIFGQHLQLQYESLKLAIDSKVECNYEIYPEQNSLRMTIFEHLLRSESQKLKTQFLKSRFIERMIAEYVKDTRRFTTKFDKIDLKFLAFTHCYPLRNEAIEFITRIISSKNEAPEIYTELVQRINMHLIIQHECGIVKSYETEPDFFVQTALLLLSNIAKVLGGAMKKDERVVEAVGGIMVKKPSLRKQFANLAELFCGGV